MQNKTKNEEEALLHAGAMGGEIIEEIIMKGGSSDFGQWSAEMYDTFIEAVVEGFTDKLRELAAVKEKMDIPF